MTIHKIDAWENGKPGSNSWISVCGQVGQIYGSNYKEDVTCKLCEASVLCDEFAALPQTKWEEI